MSDLCTKLIGKLQFHNHWQTLDIVLELQIDIYKIQTSKSVLSQWFYRFSKGKCKGNLYPFIVQCLSP